MADPGGGVSDASPASRRVHRGFVLALILGAPCLVAGAFFTPWLQYDDEKVVLDNPISRRGFTVAAWEEVSRPPRCGIALSSLSLGLQYRLLGPVPWTFRLVNLLFHLGTALLLYRIILALVPAGTRGVMDLEPTGPGAAAPPGVHFAAALGAAFFFLHPTTVESVAWAAERNNVQGLFFAVLAWWLLVSSGAEEGRLRPPSWSLHGLAWLSFAAALLTKPSAVGLAPLLVLTDVLWIRDSWPRRAARVCGIVLPAVLAASWVKQGFVARDVLPLTGGSYFSWALTSFALIGRYLQHAVAPVALSFFYAVEPVQGFVSVALWAALAGLALLLALLVWLPVGARAAVVLLGGTLLALGPALAPQMLPYLFQDRYLYYALAPAAVLAGLGFDALQYRLRFVGAGGRATRLFALAATGICLAFAALSLARSFDFRSAEVLFRDAVEKEPRSYFAHYFLAQDRYLRALEQPDRAKGLLEDAEQHILATHDAVDRERNVRGAIPLLLEGSILAKLERPSARPLLERVVEEAEPDEAEARLVALELLVELDRADYARTKEPLRLEAAALRLLWILEQRPRYAEARIRLAEAYEGLGEKDAARVEYERLRDDPHFGGKARAALERLDAPGTGGKEPLP
jgi:tetratricopeptide (TPR) repeat protein